MFTKSEISTMFSTFDITGKGYVTAQQYIKGNIHWPHLKLSMLLIVVGYLRILALQAIGVDSTTAAQPKTDKLNRDTFVELV